MYLCYFDESGDCGYTHSPTIAFSLGAVLIHENDWLCTLDQLISYRRFLRDKFGISPRQEIKSNWLNHGKGPFSNLSPTARRDVYKSAMRFQRKVGTIRTFAVVINKSLIRVQKDVREYAWTYAIQRIEKYAAANSQKVHILPDEGHGYFINKKLRAMRRFHKVPSAYNASRLDARAIDIVEDASDRHSHESYFIQLADLNAYAAMRHVLPVASFGPGMWNELGDSRITDVNSLRGGPCGIVAWP